MSAEAPHSELRLVDALVANRKQNYRHFVSFP